jgi:hypothetical protein
MGTFPLLPVMLTTDDSAQRSPDACMLGLSWFSGKPNGPAFSLHPVSAFGLPEIQSFLRRTGHRVFRGVVAGIGPVDPIR